MFYFVEDFKRYDEKYKPYGIDIEAATHLWHSHIRPEKDGMAIAAPGNKYFLKVPSVKEYSAEFEFSFDYITDFAGAIIYFGFDRATSSGYELSVKWNKNDSAVTLTLVRLVSAGVAESKSETVTCSFFPSKGIAASVKLALKGDTATILASGCPEVKFSSIDSQGAVGFSRPDFIGEIIYKRVCFTADADERSLRPPVKVEIPMLEGGTMPLTVNYELFEVLGERYLRATLDGGPKERANYEYYDPEGKREQYVVESWYMTRPYVSFGGKKYYYSMGEMNTTEGLHWKGILDVYLKMVDFPAVLTVNVRDDSSGYSFGYENLFVKGYGQQRGRAEYNFSLSGEYLGKTVFPDSFELKSPEDKYAVSMIEDGIYEADVVRDHFARGHFFAEDEEIRFTLLKNTDKKYLTYKAELQNVFGERMEELEVSRDGSISHAPLPVGVYRIGYTVLFGNEIFKELDVVFEVYDKTGEKCAPLESGLPVLYSTPNEQKYLDRDMFDPWNPGIPSNSEHFYSLSCFLGYIGERKRVWEVVKKFGRRWYAWLHPRIYGSQAEAIPEKHPLVATHADYLSYNDDFRGGSYMFDKGRTTLELIEEFLDSKEGLREEIGHKRGERFDHGKKFKLLSKYGREWSDLLVQRNVEAQKKNIRMLRTYNPDVKLAGYGPYAIYSSHLRSYSLLEYYAFPTGDELSELFFSGFCQFEDYPASCAYQTYRGPFGAGTLLAKMPRLVIYPEQYKSSPGGCIDGHVKHANPPLGKYDMPIWFNVSLTRDYVYNTAVRSADGYRFWDTYGFMHSDHPYELDDYFVRNWKYILRHKPKRVKRSPVFFAEFPKEESVYEADFTTVTNWRCYYNRSEEGIAHIYETSRIMGLPMGAYAVWDALDTLTPEDTDLIVIPSVTGLSRERLDKIRTLHNAGVSVFAVGRVDGLEDMFGVKYFPKTARVNILESDGESEVIYPYTDTFDYVSDGAEVVLSASGNPVYFSYNGCALLNVAAYSIGRIHFKEHPYLGRATNSPLYYSVTEKILKSLTSPLARADRECGITLVTDEGGRDLLVAIDYSAHDQSKINEETEYTVTLSADYKDACSLDGKPIRKLISEDGRLDAVTVTLRQHESALIELK